MIRLMGGLGNQLFQYAYGRALALSHRCPLKLDLSFYESQELREYGLGHYAIAAAIAGTEEVEVFKGMVTKRTKSWRHPFFSQGHTIIKEQNLAFDPANLLTPRDVYAEGYWQSEKYFKGYRAQLIAELTPTAPPDPENQNALRLIGNCNAVSLHIRRGDYVGNSTVSRIHGTCPLSYYTTAAARISAQVPDPVFFIFSDDIPWARINLRLDSPTHFMDINHAQDAHRDLQLMSACRHHIVANSSLSWWGAWLNPDPRKMVIAPETWFADPELNKLSATLVPEDWIRI